MHLFSPLSIGPLRLPNRIVCSALASGHSTYEGGAAPALVNYYAARALGGAGSVVIEACWPLQPAVRAAHLGLYDDDFIPGLRVAIERIHHAGAYAIVLIDQPLDIAQMADAELEQISRAWIAAAQRASQAGADGIMLSCADGGPFHQLLSPLSNRRAGVFGGTLEHRTRLLLGTAERIHARFGGHMLLGLRLLADEFTPGGVSMQDARVVARRLTGAGVNLVEVFALAGGASPMALFPGWRTPLSSAIRAVVDVPVMVGDLNDDPVFANSVLVERSADLLALGEVLRADPIWPQRARATLGLQPHQERLHR
ncbi:MAG: hypothetical protein H7Z42_14760 [Roseiflexaceae bacterium]|nr:hypothetical protein [Roseiflexaceae bacterium]